MSRELLLRAISIEGSCDWPINRLATGSRPRPSFHFEAALLY